MCPRGGAGKERGMKYWEKTGRKSGKLKEMPISREKVKETLEYVKRGHLPDWNYSTRKVSGKEQVLSLPDGSYPLHMAISVAMKALERMPDEFFEELDRKENIRQKKMEKDLKEVEHLCQHS